MTVVDKLGNEIELTGSEGVIDVNEDGSVSVTVAGLPEGSVIHWYLNGEETSAAVSGDTYTLTGLPGGDSLVEAIVVDGTTSGIGYIAFQCNKVVIQINPRLPLPVITTIVGEPSGVIGYITRSFVIINYEDYPANIQIYFRYGATVDNVGNWEEVAEVDGSYFDVVYPDNLGVKYIEVYISSEGYTDSEICSISL